MRAQNAKGASRPDNGWKTLRVIVSLRTRSQYVTEKHLQGRVQDAIQHMHFVPAGDFGKLSVVTFGKAKLSKKERETKVKKATEQWLSTKDTY